MIRIAITAEAYEAIAATLPLGSVGYEAKRTDQGDYFVWLERGALENEVRELRATVARLAALIDPLGRGGEVT
jgi:hypothetical protein